MNRMALSAVIKQCGAELPNCYLSEVEVVNGCVSKVVNTFIIDLVFLGYGRHTSAIVRFVAVQLVSEIAKEIAFDQGAEKAEVDMIDLDVQAAAPTIQLGETIWFTDTEEGGLVHWCIHDSNYPLLPGHEAPISG